MPEIRYCPECRCDSTFEQPPCLDGHGADCPEWLCVDCGLVLLVGPVPVLEPARHAVAA